MTITSKFLFKSERATICNFNEVPLFLHYKSVELRLRLRILFVRKSERIPKLLDFERGI